MVIIPNDCILSFLLDGNYSHRNLDHLMGRIRGAIKGAENPKMRGLLLQICRISLSQEVSQGRKDEDLYLGPVAVSAAFLGDASLFSKTVKKITGTCGREHYCALGELIDIQNPVVQEHDIIDALTKCKKLYQIYENLNAFRDGFFRGNPGHSDQVQIRYLTRWLNSLIYSGLHDSQNVYEADASALIRIILDREEEPFSQFVLYQGVRLFVQYFRNDQTLTDALLVELSLLFQYQSRSKIYLETLLHRIAEVAICNFDLRHYALYISSRPSLAAKPMSTESRGEAQNVVQGGPIKAFYEYISTFRSGARAQLLQRIQTQASSLTIQQSQAFLPSFLTEILTAVDGLSSEAQECIQSLIEVYITQVVGHEPRKPTDWARPEEVKCNCSCKNCSKMETFLRDPELQHYTLPKDPYHLQYRYDWFKYFKVDEAERTPIAVTKTMKRWEEQHREWESRASTTLKVLQKLPQAELKDCLGCRYDGVMNLRMVKIIDDAPENNSEGKQNDEVRSTVPRKRQRDDS
ncbi:MAG: hypothetical protein Q9211_001041 [Gyalolechia sp. 1 TL-2023]